jgi:MerT mercuric transport protein
MNKTSIVIGSSLSAISSSLVATATAFCCIGPAVIAVVGTGGALAAARLAPYRPYFIVGSVLLLGMGSGWHTVRRVDVLERRAQPQPRRSHGHSCGWLLLLQWQPSFFPILYEDDSHEEVISCCDYCNSFQPDRVYAVKFGKSI